jgi:hypothetical protein
MAYGDYNGPDKPNKGVEGGACNRRLCQAEPALFFNHGSSSWYCGDCAQQIGEDVVNKRDWELRWRPKLGHAMFETREEMDAREAAKPPPPPPMFDYSDLIYPGRQKPQSASLKKLLAAGRRRV